MEKLKSLDEIFEKRLFRIPDYQRGYAWETKQLTDFWEDLLNMHNGSQHYTGLITISEATEEEWNEKTILNRGLALLDFMEKRWELKFASEKDKKDFLFLNFIKN